MSIGVYQLIVAVDAYLMKGTHTVMLLLGNACCMKLVLSGVRPKDHTLLFQEEEKECVLILVHFCMEFRFFF